ncbi:hypothetical protein [Nocardia testacea]|uniref:hypothetical protein n=1 Tax=Nocardia testacea TaxID=248551 RepID=UPI0002EC4E1D|nr:hypothetical protein [Nocardia testacea]
MTKLFGELNYDDVGSTLVYRVKQKTHRVRLVDVLRPQTHVVASVVRGVGAPQPLTLPNDTPVVLEP